jgi:hypothetical protein
MRFHIQCQGLNSTWYQDLTNSSTSFAWACTICVESNLSNISSILLISSHKSFSPLEDENTETPSSINLKNSKQKQIDYVCKLKILCIKCQPIVNENMNYKFY